MNTPTVRMKWRDMETAPKDGSLKKPQAEGEDRLAHVARLDTAELEAWEAMRVKEAALSRAVDELREATRAWATAYAQAKTAWPLSENTTHEKAI